MTIRTSAVALALDAKDFQLTHAGVTVGLKLSYTESPMGLMSSLYVVEKTSSGWKTDKDYEMALDFLNEIETIGVNRWVVEKLVPKLNAWLRKRFSGASVTPDQLPEWVPQVLVNLDAALLTLKVTTVDGVPQVAV